MALLVRIAKRTTYSSGTVGDFHSIPFLITLLVNLLRCKDTIKRGKNKEKMKVFLFFLFISSGSILFKDTIKRGKNKEKMKVFLFFSYNLNQLQAYYNILFGLSD